MAIEKLNDPLTVKLDFDKKRKLFGLAAMHGTDASDIVRTMIDNYISEHEREYEAMNSIFGQTGASDNG